MDLPLEAKEQLGITPCGVGQLQPASVEAERPRMAVWCEECS